MRNTLLTLAALTLILCLSLSPTRATVGGVVDPPLAGRYQLVTGPLTTIKEGQVLTTPALLRLDTVTGEVSMILGKTEKDGSANYGFIQIAR